MKAKGTKLLRNEDADVGIGTLIIFIAMVLVAAVAAAVLIQTSGILQQKAQQTGKEATAEVSSNLKIISVTGKVAGSAITKLTLLAEVSAGGNPIDVNRTSIKYIDATSSTFLTGTNVVYTEDRYTDATNGTDYVLEPGELGKFVLTLPNSMTVRNSSTIQFIPETGTMVTRDIVAPSTFGGQTEIQLFP
jgi:archaeal flagellin FlaB